uniref:von Willebrand factor D and EGF domains n=1 Tax=Nothobranchius furzeri TaxID=105023 RepID=A0A8C6LVS9_NOTFU
MSLSLRAPGSDRNHTEGLCGTFDGQPDNDFHTAGGTELEEHQAFISEWRLPPGSSLFDSVPSHEKTPETHNYCTCRVNPPVSFPRTPSQQTSSDSSCSSFGVISFPSFIPTLDVTAEYISSMEPPTINQRQQIASDPSSKSSHGGSSHIPGSSRTMSSSTQHRQTPVHLSLSWSEQKSFSYFFPEDHKEAVQPEVSPTWPTPSSLTQEQAWGQCQQTVANSSIAVGCRLLLQESVISRAMQMCVSDLQLKDEPLWLSGTLPLLENECERKLVEEGGMKLEYQDALHILRCPNLCSGNGQCSDWGCVCFPGFGSYDCSVLMDQIPEITKLEKDGLCDIHVEDCSTIRVFGHSFMVSRTLKCEFVKEKFEDGEWLLDAPRFVPTTSLNETALECQLPLEDSRDPAGVDLAAGTNGPLARWQIKVSNDGYSFSNAKILTLYDGACQTCSLDSDVTCSLKEKTCSIDGLCYRDGESSPSSPCLTCNPALSQHTWSKTQKNRPPVFQSPRFRLRSFHEENFIHQLQAEDPEGSVVLFTLVSGPEGTSLSPDGLLRWKATAKPTDTHMFHFTVADSCGAESSASVQVFVQSCECLNGAACITDVNSHANSGEHRCACLDGFMGRRCEVEVDSCKPNPCRLGRCINRANAFTCICPPGMTGFHKLNHFLLSSIVHRSLQTPPAGKVAVCRYQCGGNMQCTLPNTCTCRHGYTGYNCHIAVCRPDCKNQGKCVKPGVCECSAGYSGPTCEEASCEPPCRHGGTCLSRNLCTCPYGFVGPRCEIMVCNRHCENGGECVSPDVCRCKPGWFGPTCNSALCEPMCLNGGSCVKPNTCACPTGFYGSQCQIAVCSPPCKNRGQCMRNNICSCPEGYTGKRHTCALKQH